jgi:hypothetical protein
MHENHDTSPRPLASWGPLQKTWSKFLTEAENKNVALDTWNDWQYLGYVEAGDAESSVVD